MFSAPGELTWWAASESLASSVRDVASRWFIFSCLSWLRCVLRSVRLSSMVVISSNRMGECCVLYFLIHMSSCAFSSAVWVCSCLMRLFSVSRCVCACVVCVSCSVFCFCDSLCVWMSCVSFCNVSVCACCAVVSGRIFCSVLLFVWIVSVSCFSLSFMSSACFCRCFSFWLSICPAVVSCMLFSWFCFLSLFSLFHCSCWSRMKVRRFSGVLFQTLCQLPMHIFLSMESIIFVCSSVICVSCFCSSSVL